MENDGVASPLLAGAAAFAVMKPKRRSAAEASLADSGGVRKLVEAIDIGVSG